MRGLRILAEAQWNLGRAATVLQSDASEQKWDHMTAQWPVSEVTRCGRQLERTQFRRIGSHRVRASALEAAVSACNFKGLSGTPVEGEDLAELRHCGQGGARGGLGAESLGVQRRWRLAVL